jgi:hypothetical protein
MVMAGPALAGVLVALTGYAWTYSIDVILMRACSSGSGPCRTAPEGEIVRRDSSRSSTAGGSSGAPNIRLQYILDITR